MSDQEWQRKDHVGPVPLGNSECRDATRCGGDGVGEVGWRRVLRAQVSSGRCPSGLAISIKATLKLRVPDDTALKLAIKQFSLMVTTLSSGFYYPRSPGRETLAPEFQGHPTGNWQSWDSN